MDVRLAAVGGSAEPCRPSRNVEDRIAFELGLPLPSAAEMDARAEEFLAKCGIKLSDVLSQCEEFHERVHMRFL